MKTRFVLQLLFFGLVVLVISSVITAIAATNTIPATRLDNQTSSITPNDVKPPSCITLDLQDIISGSGIITGTEGNDLILGSAGNDTINGLGGTDCILSGGGDDTISGGSNNDICNSGGDAEDSFDSCEITIP